MTVRPVLFDTSVYVPYLRREAYGDLLARAVRARRTVVSAVVAAELYAGTRTAADKADLDVLVRGHEALGLLVVPVAADWACAGQAIRRGSRLYGQMEPRDHMHDLLIAISAARVGAEVVTENALHFRRWASLLRRMDVHTRVRAVVRTEHLDRLSRR
jgi:predicted nucleic acid-binding protein